MSCYESLSFSPNLQCLQSNFSVNHTAEMCCKTLYNKIAKAKVFNNENQDGLISAISI